MLLKAKFFQALLLGTTLAAGLMTVPFVLPTSQAQTSKGTLTGEVRDGSGSVIANATVTATNLDNHEVRSTSTSSQGAYRFDALTPGHYTLQAEAKDFEKFEATDLNVPPSQTVSYNPVLKLGHVNETVSVSASDILLDQENGSLSTSIGQEAMAKLPIFTLNPIEVLTTVPGVQVVSNSGMSNGAEIQVSGARPRANNFLVDGEEINDSGIGGQAVQPDIPDMYADTVIYTHNPPAEFGRASGGVVNLITKGGTNTYHGSAWELYSGSGLNSTDGQTRQIVPKDRGNKARFDEHQFGFTVGGYILKDKLFAFGAAQWTRFYGNEQASPVDLPNSDGVALLQQIEKGNNPTTAANATLLLSYLSDASYLTTFNDISNLSNKQLGAACPANTPGCTLGIDQFQRKPTPESTPDTQWSYRIDYDPWSKDSFSARYLHDRTSLTPDFFTNGTSLPGFDTQQGGPSELGQGTWTHVFSHQLLNEFRVSEARLGFLFSPTAQTQANPLFTAPTLNFADLTSLGFDQNFPQGRTQDTYQFQDTVSWMHGRQSIRAGADVGRRIDKVLVGQNANGALTFAKGGSGSSAEGNFLLDQLGPSGQATRTFGSTRIDPHSWRSGFFAQDDVKVSPSLTVNLGFRYDYFTAPENVLKYPAIDPNNLYAPIDTVFQVASDTNNFAPRVGFAYTPHLHKWLADGKSVVRGGFGIFYDSDFSNIAVNSAQSSPNAVAGTLIQTTGNGLTGATGLIPQITAVLNPKSSVLTVVNNLSSPYTEEWNLGIERELPGQIGLSVTYVGSKGNKLFANQQYNYFDFDSGLRINPLRGSINARGNFAASIYNGLEVGVKHNFNHGFLVTGAYTYSKTRDNGSEVFTPDSSATSYAADLAPGGRRYEWGNSVYDHRQYAAFTYLWSPKGFHSEDKRIDYLLSSATRHWTISGATRLQSGAYSTVNISGMDTNGDGSTANDRPIQANKSAPMDSVGIDGAYLACAANAAPGCVDGTPGVYYDLAVNNNGTNNDLSVVDPKNVRWLIPNEPNYAALAIGRNSFLNPSQFFSDIALEKAVPTNLLHLSRGQFLIRAEVENLANHNNVGLVDINLLDVGSNSFMNKSQVRDSASTSIDGNRNLRFWIKYSF